MADIKTTVSIVFEGINNATPVVQALDQQVDQLTSALREAQNASGDLNQGISGLGDVFGGVEQGFLLVGGAATTAATGLNTAAVSGARLPVVLGAAIPRLATASTNINLLAASSATAVPQITRLNNELSRATLLLGGGGPGGGGGFGGIGSGGFADDFGDFGAAAGGAATQTGLLAGGLRLLAPLFAGLGVIEVTKQFVEANKAFEVTQFGLEAVTGSAAQAARDFEYLKDVSILLGRDLISTADDFLQLSAATQGTSLEGEETRRIFEAVTTAMAVLGRSSSDTSLALRAIQQIVNKNTVSMEELRQQLGERLPGAFRLAAEAMGLTTEELAEQVAQGRILAVDLLPRLATEIQKTYGEVRPIDTFNASVGRLQTNFDLLLVAIGDTGAFEQLGNIVDAIAIVLGDAATGVERVSEAFSRLLIAAGTEERVERFFSLFKTEVDGLEARLVEPGLTEALNFLLNPFARNGQGVLSDLGDYAVAVSNLFTDEDVKRFNDAKFAINESGQSAEALQLNLEELGFTTEEANEEIFKIAEGLRDGTIEAEELSQGVYEVADGIDLVSRRTEVALTKAEELRKQFEETTNEMAGLAEGTNKVNEVLEDIGIDPDNINEPIQAAVLAFKELINLDVPLNFDQIFDGLLVTLDRTAVRSDDLFATLKDGLEILKNEGKISATEFGELLEVVDARIDSLNGNGDTWNKTYKIAAETLQEGADAAQDKAKELEKTQRAAEKLRLEFAKLASDERIARIEANVELNVAKVEADTRRVEAAFEALNVTINSTGDVLSSALGVLGDLATSGASGFTAGFRLLEEQLLRENERRDRAIDAQIKLVEVETRLAQLKADQLANGEPLLKIDGTGLQPHLEAFMFEILEAIQVRVNAEGLDLLVGA